MKNFYIFWLVNCYLQWFFEKGDIWLDKRTVHKRSQNWEVHLDETDSTIAFESLRWRGFYLCADDDADGWLELKSKRKIKWIASAHVPDDNNSENQTIMALWV